MHGEVEFMLTHKKKPAYDGYNTGRCTRFLPEGSSVTCSLRYAPIISAQKICPQYYGTVKWGDFAKRGYFAIF